MGLFRRKRARKPQPRWKQWLKAAGWALLILLVIRNFIFHWTVVESTSMSNTLLPGDLMVVNHLNYGPRFPQSVIAIPFTDAYANASLPYWRWFGFGEIEAGDLLVFNDPSEKEIPVDRKTQLVKRVIGLPGDEVAIDNDLVTVNGGSEYGFGYQSYNFLVQFQRGFDPAALIDSLVINEGQAMPDGAHFILNLDSTALYGLKSHAKVVDIQHWQDDTPGIHELIWPAHANHPMGWDLYNFGPFELPEADQTIGLDDKTILKYGRLLEEYEGMTVDYTHFSVNNADGEHVTTHTFLYDYYFVLGDNRHNSTDSRFWGPVPETHIIGTASFVLFSSDPETGLRGERWFMGL